MGDAYILSTLILVRSRMSFHLDVCTCTPPQLFCLRLLHSMVSAVNSRCIQQSSDSLTKTHTESLSLLCRLYTQNYASFPERSHTLSPLPSIMNLHWHLL
jgi:hypothetical protein